LQGFFGVILGSSQLALRLALGQRILPKHRDCPSHLADLVACLRALYGHIVFLRDDGVHGIGDIPKRENDAARDGDAGNDDEGEKDDGDQRDAQVEIGQGVIEAALRPHLAQPHLRGRVSRGEGGPFLI
jgi:hypothetical protein